MVNTPRANSVISSPKPAPTTYEPPAPPVKGKAVLAEAEAKAGFKELNVRPVMDKESGAELGYRATISYCPIDPKTGLEIACVSGMGTGNTPEEAKDSAKADAMAKYTMSQKK